ncbi:MAG: DUF4296 domain-containing protein [Chitinophagales bacterium]|nr:DUF4296 domain-containing protein [Chitinophagales bacterium]
MRITFFIVLVTLVVACGSKGDVPKDVLPKEKMEDVMWDMLRADEFVKEYMLARDSSLRDTAEYIKMYERIFRLNKTNREQYAESFTYYRTHPKLMKEILDSLNVRGQLQSLPAEANIPEKAPFFTDPPEKKIAKPVEVN